MQDDCGGLDEVLIELPGCSLVLGSRFEATDAFLHIFSIERFRITCTHPGCPRIEYAREITEAEDARIIAEIKDKIEIRELTPEGRAAFIEKSKPIYKEFESRVTPELLDKALKAAAGN